MCKLNRKSMNRTKKYKLKLNYLFLFILINSFHCYSQENLLKSGSNIKQSIENRKHEIKIGALKALCGPILDIEYERILNKYSSFGGNTIINFNQGTYLYNFLLSPFYRMYFTQVEEYGTKGFFAQGFLSYYTGKNNIIYDNKKFNSFGIGFGIGKKWVNKQGFVFQFVLGGGRTISGGYSAPEYIFQGDISIGYRF